MYYITTDRAHTKGLSLKIQINTRQVQWVLVLSSLFLLCTACVRARARFNCIRIDLYAKLVSHSRANYRAPLGPHIIKVSLARTRGIRYVRYFGEVTAAAAANVSNIFGRPRPSLYGYTGEVSSEIGTNLKKKGRMKLSLRAHVIPVIIITKSKSNEKRVFAETRTRDYYRFSINRAVSCNCKIFGARRTFIFALKLNRIEFVFRLIGRGFSGARWSIVV